MNYRRIYFKVLPIKYKFYNSVMTEARETVDELDLLESDDFYPIAFSYHENYYIVVVSLCKFKNKFTIVKASGERPTVVEEESILYYPTDPTKTSGYHWIGKFKPKKEFGNVFDIVVKHLLELWETNEKVI